jgi:hypothetical protein
MKRSRLAVVVVAGLGEVGWEEASRSWPQFEQNLAPGKNSAPQFGQARLNFVPQFEQNLALSALDAPQVGHSIVFSFWKASGRQVIVIGDCVLPAVCYFLVENTIEQMIVVIQVRKCSICA